jgi:hypothetical protein
MLAIAVARDQGCPLKHAQVPGDCRAGYGERRGKFAKRGFPATSGSQGRPVELDPQGRRGFLSNFRNLIMICS